MRRAIWEEVGGILIEYNEVEKFTTNSIIFSFLQATLQAYANIFQLKLNLPPKRNQDHSISLKDGIKLSMDTHTSKKWNIVYGAIHAQGSINKSFL